MSFLSPGHFCYQGENRKLRKLRRLVIFKKSQLQKTQPFCWTVHTLIGIGSGSVTYEVSVRKPLNNRSDIFRTAVHDQCRIGIGNLTRFLDLTFKRFWPQKYFQEVLAPKIFWNKLILTYSTLLLFKQSDSLKLFD